MMTRAVVAPIGPPRPPGLYSALSQAERWKLIVRNPATLLEKRDRPKIERKSVHTIDAASTAAASTPRASAGSSYPCCWRRSAAATGRNHCAAMEGNRSGQQPACRHRQY